MLQIALQICRVFIIVDQSHLLSSRIGWIAVALSKMRCLTLSLLLQLVNPSQPRVPDKEGGHNINEGAGEVHISSCERTCSTPGSIYLLVVSRKLFIIWPFSLIASSGVVDTRGSGRDGGTIGQLCPLLKLYPFPSDTELERICSNGSILAPKPTDHLLDEQQPPPC